MKKIIAIVISASLFSLSACGENNSTSSSNPQKTEKQKDGEQKLMHFDKRMPMPSN